MLPAGFRGLRKGCCGTHFKVVAGGWVVAWEWGIPGPESGNGWWIPGTESGNWWRGNRGAGNGNSESAGIRNSRNSETGNGFGIDGCAHLCTESGNSAEFTPGNPPETAPETPGKPPN